MPASGSETPKPFTDAERRFAAMTSMDALAVTASDTPRHVSFQDMVNVIVGGQTERAPAVFQAARTNPVLRRDVDSLLRRVGGFRQEALAAASSGDVRERQVNGDLIIITESRVEPTQRFVRIILAEGRAVPRHMSVEVDDSTYIKVLPAPFEGRIQLLLEVTDPFLQALWDPATVVTIW